MEFKKDKREKKLFLPGTIKRINIKYELMEPNKRNICRKQLPYLISIKDFYFYNEIIAFYIDLSEIYDIYNLQIRILNITVILYSGKKLEYSISRTFILSEVCINEDCYANFRYDEIKAENKTENSFLHEKVFQELIKDLKNNKEKSTIIYEKKSVNNKIDNDLIINLVRQNTEAMNGVVEQLKELNSTLKNMPLQNMGYVSPGISQGGVPKRLSDWRSNPNLSDPSLALRAPGKLPYLAELKGIMKDDDKFKKYLKPMDEKELKKITLNDEVLEEKQRETIERQIKRLEKKKPKEIILENLKEPK
ncbi:MAG: hypothetical protein EU539_04975 [Promethearchaeota archaeon]|nr:MAG: hypothetical protein EU539_04975 [Candidatus Lokiarchaeota archaeon]